MPVTPGIVSTSSGGTQGGTTGATTNAVVKATGANTLGDTSLTESSGVITGMADIAPGITGGTVSAGTTGKNVTLTGSAAKAGSGANGGAVVLIGGAGDGGGYRNGVHFGGIGAGWPWLRGNNTDYIELFKGDASAYGELRVATLDISAGYTNATNFVADQASGSFVCAHAGGDGQFKWYTSAYDTGLGRSAAGVVKVTDGDTGQGALLAKRVISAKTSDYPIVAADTGTVFTNTGASGTVVFTLPAAPANGLTYEFHITAAQSVDIQTGTAVLIYANAAATTATTGKLTKNTVGTCIQLVYNGVAWMGVGQSGTWTVS